MSMVRVLPFSLLLLLLPLLNMLMLLLLGPKNVVGEEDEGEREVPLMQVLTNFPKRHV